MKYEFIAQFRAFGPVVSTVLAVGAVILSLAPADACPGWARHSHAVFAGIALLSYIFILYLGDPPDDLPAPPPRQKGPKAKRAKKEVQPEEEEGEEDVGAEDDDEIVVKEAKRRLAALIFDNEEDHHDEEDVKEAKRRLAAIIFNKKAKVPKDPRSGTKKKKGKGGEEEDEEEDEEGEEEGEGELGVLRALSSTKSSGVAIPTMSHPSQGGQSKQQQLLDSKLAQRLGGRCPLVINYGHMSHLALGTGEVQRPVGGGGSQSQAEGGGGHQSSQQQQMMMAAARGGADFGFGGSYDPAMMMGSMGGVADGSGGGGGQAEGKRKGAKDASSGSKNSSKQGGRNRGMSDYDRVLSQHASSCLTRCMAGQDLADAIKTEQTTTPFDDAIGDGVDGGGSASKGEQGSSDFGWIDDLENKGHKDIVFPVKRLQSDFFRQQRGGKGTLKPSGSNSSLAGNDTTKNATSSTSPPSSSSSPEAGPRLVPDVSTGGGCESGGSKRPTKKSDALDPKVGGSGTGGGNGGKGGGEANASISSSTEQGGGTTTNDAGGGSGGKGEAEADEEPPPTSSRNDGGVPSDALSSTAEEEVHHQSLAAALETTSSMSPSFAISTHLAPFSSPPPSHPISNDDKSAAASLSTTIKGAPFSPPQAFLPPPASSQGPSAITPSPSSSTTKPAAARGNRGKGPPPSQPGEGMEGQQESMEELALLGDRMMREKLSHRGGGRGGGGGKTTARGLASSQGRHGGAGGGGVSSEDDDDDDDENVGISGSPSCGPRRGRQRTGRTMTGGGRSMMQGKGKEEHGTEEPKAYQGDLEYLQDQFRLLAIVLKKNEILIQIREKLLIGRSEAEASGAMGYLPSDPALLGLQGMMMGGVGSPPTGGSSGRSGGRKISKGGGVGGGGRGGGAQPVMGPDGMMMMMEDGQEMATSRRKVEEAEEDISDMRERIRARLVQTFEDQGGWIPRLEILAKALHLQPFEKFVLVLLLREYLTSRYLGAAGNGLGGSSMDGGDRLYRQAMAHVRGGGSRRYDIKTLCAYFSVTFAEQLQAANQFFSKDAPLVQNSIITFHTYRDELGMMMGGGGSHIHVLDALVVMDEKMADFLLGFDETPASQVPVKGNFNLYSPTVSLDDVILPKATLLQVQEALAGLNIYWDIQRKVIDSNNGGAAEASSRGAEARREEGEGGRASGRREGAVTEEEAESEGPAREGDPSSSPLPTTTAKSNGNQSQNHLAQHHRGATVFLLAGRHGVGKSTLADAIAKALNKKVLLVEDAGDLVHTSLQAKIHDAIVVVEDMKSLADDTSNGGGPGGSSMSSLSALFGGKSKHKARGALKELETAQNLFIFQTESLESVPSSIARRLGFIVELQSPDSSMRKQIWEALKPSHVQLADDVDLDELAMRWVLPGGLIKEAWTSAQVSSVLRSSTTVTQADLMKAAQRQLHGKLQLANLAEKTTPLRGLDQAVLPEPVKRDLKTMIDYARVSGVLFGQWGFDLHHGTTRGMSALFYGPPGTGKTLAAEILAYELGKPIKKVNLAETVSMWVGETEKNLEALLKESKEADVVLFLDEAESLLRKRTEQSASYESRWSNLLLQRIETYEGVLVAATNLCESVDTAYRRRFKFWVDFPKPGPDDRGGIWRTLIPPQAPLSSDVDLKALGKRFELTGGEIKSAVFRAGMRAASRSLAKKQEITMKDLVDAAEEEMKKKSESGPLPQMYT